MVRDFGVVFCGWVMTLVFCIGLWFSVSCWVVRLYMFDSIDCVILVMVVLWCLVIVFRNWLTVLMESSRMCTLFSVGRICLFM